MASLQHRSGSWRAIFRHRGSQHFVTIGNVDEVEAQGVMARYEYLLRLLKQRLLSLPPGMDFVTFLRQDGKPPENRRAADQPEISLAQLRDEYLKTFGNGAVENNTLYTSRIHLAHLADTLGEHFLLSCLSHADLQRHITRRSPSDRVAAVTIKKEMDTFRSAWNWAKRMRYVQEDFPGTGLVYPKGQDKLPFMTWTEIERRISVGGDPEALWECLYLRESEITKFLDFIQQCRAPVWVYPMCVMAAHTGARRSEMLRAEWQDMDFEAGVITIREKKRVKGKATTRRVPMSSRLRQALAALPDAGTRLFGDLSVQAAQKALRRVVGKAPSAPRDAKASKQARIRAKWSVLKGYHVLRHSFISALANKGIDQRNGLIPMGRIKQRRLWPLDAIERASQLTPAVLLAGFELTKIGHHALARAALGADRLDERPVSMGLTILAAIAAAQEHSAILGARDQGEPRIAKRGESVQEQRSSLHHLLNKPPWKSGGNPCSGT